MFTYITTNTAFLSGFKRISTIVFTLVYVVGHEPPPCRRRRQRRLVQDLPENANRGNRRSSPVTAENRSTDDHTGSRAAGEWRHAGVLILRPGRVKLITYRTCTVHRTSAGDVRPLWKFNRPFFFFQNTSFTSV